MSSPHAHAEFLRALADGEVIETRLEGCDDEWVPVLSASTTAMHMLLNPAMWTNAKYEFRVAQEAA
ncbi:hypothetical protein FVQ98_10460 [Ottowia sp. GY511]|uniref:Uncharacterized protein n=1 Tax=Ottowia flava TaxID=2675430 RepID=A0ABW4KQG1_9BURK|nr:hypothetical protein [Ottowia sp. GY511]TXK27735.1 hypothetical protein FVQ98_10460 [Ottowia sp. GY511]